MSNLDEEPRNIMKTKKFWKDITGEYFATCLLVYAITSVCDVETNDDYLEYSLVYGMATAILVQCFGGFLNPALTVAFTSTGRLPLTKGVFMIIVEVLGGISGAGLTYMLTPPSLRFNLGDTFLHDDVSAIQGLFIEFILTLIFTLSVYAVTDIRHSKGYLRSLFYGFAVTLCSLIGSKTTRCSINPARSFGPAVIRELSGISKGRRQWQQHWIYWIGPIGGSLMAVVVQYFLYSTPGEKHDVSARNKRSFCKEKEYRKTSTRDDRLPQHQGHSVGV